jgi:hypothetical protein
MRMGHSRNMGLIKVNFSVHAKEVKERSSIDEVAQLPDLYTSFLK